MTIATYAPAELTPATDRWSESALRVLKERYLIKDDQGNIIETPEEMCWRVARAVAEAERAYVTDGRDADEVVDEYARQFATLMINRDFMPNTPTLVNAGRNNNQTLSACFVIPVGDSMEEIFDALKAQAIIQKAGGGTGMSFSRLRPKGAIVKGTMQPSSGALSFMHLFDSVTASVKQGGVRRGANMGILRVDHPEILDFIDMKRKQGWIEYADGRREEYREMTNFNVSVAVTDAFMAALDAIDDRYDLLDPQTQAPYDPPRHLYAREVWEQICRRAWESGDPGLFFIDRANNGPQNPIPSINKLESTNPCGEICLFPWDVCNLLSVNLSHFVDDQGFRWAAFRRTCRTATRFLDNVIDVNPYPLQQIRDLSNSIRRIGLGFMGFAEALILLGIPYDTAEGRAFGERIMRELREAALEESEQLAIERGCFPLQSQSIYANDPPRRHSNLNMVAPTGTTSIIAGCSSGCEPLFSLGYRHTVPQPDGTTRVLNITFPVIEQVGRREGWWSDAIGEEIVTTGSAQQIEAIPPHWRNVLKGAQEIAPEDHVRMQAAIQKHNENATSKSVNLPNSAIVADIAHIYRLAWDTGCIGTTIFRDGCLQWQVLNAPTEQPTTIVSGPISATPLSDTDAKAASPFLAMVAAQDGHLTHCPNDVDGAECGAPLVYEEGCKKCYACGWSAC